MMPLPYPMIDEYLEELRGLRGRLLQAMGAPARFARWCGRRAAAVRIRAGSVQRGHAPDAGSLHGSR